VILFKEKIDILSFIGFLGFPINRMLYLLFYMYYMIVQQYITKTPKYKRKELAFKGITTSLILNGFRKFLTSGSCGLLLEVGHLDDLWFVIT